MCGSDVWFGHVFGSGADCLQKLRESGFQQCGNDSRLFSQDFRQGLLTLPQKESGKRSPAKGVRQKGVRQKEFGKKSDEKVTKTIRKSDQKVTERVPKPKKK